MEREREEALSRNVDKARGVLPAGKRDRELGSQKTGGGGDDGGNQRPQDFWAARRRRQGYHKVNGKWVKGTKKK